VEQLHESGDANLHASEETWALAARHAGLRPRGPSPATSCRVRHRPAARRFVSRSRRRGSSRSRAPSRQRSAGDGEPPHDLTSRRHA
jgi:hypothetical protein